MPAWLRGTLLGPSDDKNIDFELYEFRYKALDTVQFSLNVAVLNQDVFFVNVTEISQPLPERFDVSSGSPWITTTRNVSYPRDSCRLLREDRMDEEQKQDTRNEIQNQFMHVHPNDMLCSADYWPSSSAMLMPLFALTAQKHRLRRSKWIFLQVKIYEGKQQIEWRINSATGE